MSAKHITFVSCTRGPSQGPILNKALTPLQGCWHEQAARCGNKARGWQVDFRYNNTEKLSVNYNQYLTEEYRDQYVVFLHDDVSLNFESACWELRDALTKFAVIGVAGATDTVLKKPILWHLMTSRDKLSGAVAHDSSKYTNGVPSQHMTPFGPYPQRCVLMDGVFLAVDVSKLLDAKVQFDTTNPAIAHFYDLDFCLSANQAGLKMSTWPIYITHRSPGLLSMEDAQWKEGQEWFINKWAPHLKNS